MCQPNSDNYLLLLVDIRRKFLSRIYPIEFHLPSYYYNLVENYDLLQNIKRGTLTVYQLIRDTILSYQRDKIFRMGAALSYYTIFSLPAIIIIAIAFVGFFFGEDAVKGKIFGQIDKLIGPEAALQIQEVIIGVSDYDQNWWATLFGVAMLVFGATGVFYALQEALNKIFGVQSPIRIGVIRILTNRALAFGMVIAICFIVVISLLLNTVLITFANFVADIELLQNYSPNWTSSFSTSALLIFKNVGSFMMFTLFFAAVYKVLPNVYLKWKHIWAGAILTAILFGIGEFLLGFYLSNTNFWSAYGAAGFIVVILIWVNYSSQMIFIGAEFIKVYCKHKGYEIKPKNYAAISPWKSKFIIKKEDQHLAEQ